MKVKVLGKSRIDVVSKKTGQPFCATVLHSVYPHPQVPEGERVEQIMVNDNLDCPVLKDIHPGSVCSVEYDSRGFVVDVQLLEKEVGQHPQTKPGRNLPG